MNPKRGEDPVHCAHYAHLVGLLIDDGKSTDGLPDLQLIGSILAGANILQPHFPKGISLEDITKKAITSVCDIQKTQ